MGRERQQEQEILVICRVPGYCVPENSEQKEYNRKGGKQKTINPKSGMNPWYVPEVPLER